MTPSELKSRTKKVGIAVIALVDALPRRRSTDIIGKHLVRSATSVGANYRAACRARSNAEFLAKMGIVEEEADESAHWIETLIDAKLVSEDDAYDLLREATELTAIAVSSIKTARKGPRSQ